MKTKLFILVFISLIQIRLYAVNTLISFTGQFRDSSDTPYSSGSLQIEIRSNGVSGTIVWGPYQYDNALDSQGSFNLILGKNNTLNLHPGMEYNMIVRVDYNAAAYSSADRVFGDDSPSGDVIIVHSGANDVYLLNDTDTMSGNLTVESNLLVKGNLRVLGNTYLGTNLYVTNNIRKGVWARNKIWILRTNNNAFSTNDGYIGVGINGDISLCQKNSRWMRFINGGDFVWHSPSQNIAMRVATNGYLRVWNGIFLGDSDDSLGDASSFYDSITGGNDTDLKIEQNENKWMRFVNGNDFTFFKNGDESNTNMKAAIRTGNPSGIAVRNKVWMAATGANIYTNTRYIGCGVNDDMTIYQKENQWMRFVNNNDFVWVRESDGNVRMKLSLSTGDLYIDGSTYHTGGADFAECFKKTEMDIRPGDVLVISDNGKLKKCRKSNSSKIAGVCSKKPGIVLGIKEDGKMDKDDVIVALVGQVKVNVCNYSGNIKPGDLLTTSPIPGYAMKAKQINMNGVKIYRPGTILGKALEKFNGEKGEILVLIHLQ